MQTFNQSLADLYFRRHVTLQTALSVSHHPEELREMIQRGVGTIGGGAVRPAKK
jgi:Tfp pilus assembly ATPase PilU